MKKATLTRRKRATETGQLIGQRWQKPDVEAIDKWRRQQPDLPQRTEAIRRLVRLGLAASRGKG